MRFQVTQEMIDAGKCYSMEKCAMALALNCQLPLPPGYRYQVWDSSVCIVTKYGRCIQDINFSKSIQKFIKDFDTNPSSVSPRSFQI